jgi:hypothetical protein
MNEKQSHYDWGFGLQWLIVVAIGMAVASMLAFAFVWGVGDLVEDALGTAVAMFITGSIFGAIFALGCSLGSGLLLRRDHVETGRWILNSVVAGAIGMGFAFTLVFTLFDAETMPEVLAGLLIGIFLGLPIGIAQWAVFRREGIVVNEWILISTLAYLLAFLAGLPLGGENRELLSVSVISLLVGAISGLGIVWLRRRRQTAVAV